MKNFDIAQYMCVYMCVHACVCVVTQPQQLRGHITSRNLIMEFGMPDGINALVMQHRLQWLGHVGRMRKDFSSTWGPDSSSAVLWWSTSSCKVDRVSLWVWAHLS